MVARVWERLLDGGAEGVEASLLFWLWQAVCLAVACYWRQQKCFPSGKLESFERFRFSLLEQVILFWLE